MGFDGAAAAASPLLVPRRAATAGRRPSTPGIRRDGNLVRSGMTGAFDPAESPNMSGLIRENMEEIDSTGRRDGPLA